MLTFRLSPRWYHAATDTPNSAYYTSYTGDAAPTALAVNQEQKFTEPQEQLPQRDLGRGCC